MAPLIRLKNPTVFNSSSHGYHLIVFHPRFNISSVRFFPPPKKNAPLIAAERRVKKLDTSLTSGRRPPSIESSLDSVESFPFLEAACFRVQEKIEGSKVVSSIFQLSNGKKCLPGMYSNDYDDGTLMNSYIRWSKRYNVTSLPFFIVSFLFLSATGRTCASVHHVRPRNWDTATIRFHEFVLCRLARLHQRTLRIYQENEYMHHDDQGPYTEFN